MCTFTFPAYLLLSSVATHNTSQGCNLLARLQGRSPRTSQCVRLLQLSQAHLCVAERELVLVKVRAPPGVTRTEVMQLTDIFRARIVDVSDVSLTVCATGDAGKVCG